MTKILKNSLRVRNIENYFIKVRSRNVEWKIVADFCGRKNFALKEKTFKLLGFVIY